MLLMMAAMFAALSWLVMRLWNWLTPEVFGWHPISFWQALGLFLLSKILFGGIRGGWGHRGLRGRHMKERWENMSPEQREKLRKSMMGMVDCVFARPGSSARGGTEPDQPAGAPAAER
jgi:hypothetical protein